jgi:hypothetical protein
MMIPNIEDLTTEPIVGKFYMVPCVDVESREGIFLPIGRLPVTGPKHEDADHVKFPWHHWHYDLRFLSDLHYSRVGMEYGYSHVLNTQTCAIDSRPIPGMPEKPVWRRMKCRREAPAYPHAQAERSFLPPLRLAYADARVKCGKCPHRGLPLSSLPREPEADIVTCVGHGLRWDLKTGNLVNP